MRNFELKKITNTRWMVMCDGKAYAGFSTKKVAKAAMENYIAQDKKRMEKK